MRVLLFPLEHIDKYYQKKFMFDMSHYFEIEGWDFIPRGTFPEMTEKNVIRKLYKRGLFTFDGLPAVYLGAGRRYSTEQNFEFCGMFIHMWLVDKCLRKLYGKEDALLFCKSFSWPIIETVQPDEDFDLVATLKEAGLAPAKAESENYLTMLDAVLPYMQEKTKAFLMHYDLQDDIDQFVKSSKEKMVDKSEIEQKMVDKWSVRPSLAEKLVGVLDFVADKGTITTEIVATHFGYPVTTAKRYLRQLTEFGYLESNGGNKNRTYCRKQ